MKGRVTLRGMNFLLHGVISVEVCAGLGFLVVWMRVGNALDRTTLGAGSKPCWSGGRFWGLNASPWLGDH